MFEAFSNCQIQVLYYMQVLMNRYYSLKHT